MDFNILQEFRQYFYDTLSRAKDSLFNCADALLTETAAQSFVELALSPHFKRKWPSLYEGFEDGKLDRAALRQLFANFVPHPTQDKDWLVVGVDASNIVRPQAFSLQDRGALYLHNLPECDKPITYGWQFSVVAALPELTSSWCYILDSCRIATSQTASQVAASQLAALAKLLAARYRLLVVADRYYGSATFIKALLEVDAQVDGLLRIKSDRVFYRPVPVLSGKRGRGAPRKDGERFQCKDETTHRSPERSFQTTDERGCGVEVLAWDNLHFRQVREVKVSVIKVTRQGASRKKGDPLVSWFIWQGKQQLALEKVVTTYKRRFSIEHTFRFIKQDLLWEKARLHTPAQFELWSNVVAFVLNELVLARSFNQAYQRPWESKERAASPQQVRRGMASIITTLGSPARHAKGRGKSPGRAKGTTIERRKRWPVVKKAGKKAPKLKKLA